MSKSEIWQIDAISIEELDLLWVTGTEDSHPILTANQLQNSLLCPYFFQRVAQRGWIGSNDVADTWSRACLYQATGASARLRCTCCAPPGEMHNRRLLQCDSQGNYQTDEIVSFFSSGSHTHLTLNSAIVWGTSAKHSRGQKVGLDHVLEDEDGKSLATWADALILIPAV